MEKILKIREKTHIFCAFWILIVCNGFKMPKIFSGRLWNIFEKNLIFFDFLTPPWAFSEKILKIDGQKLAKNGFLRSVGNMWKTLKNPNFDKIWIFEGCGGSRMSKIYS